VSLSTHVLDTVNGRPAAGVGVTLRKDGAVIAETATNEDGRAAFGDVGDGGFELEFAVGAYFGEAPFLDAVPIRFTIADAGAHYHVPLLVSPWAYSTYRGS
jgi:5-hydroxyisourate hydrolase